MLHNPVAKHVVPGNAGLCHFSKLLHVKNVGQFEYHWSKKTQQWRYQSNYLFDISSDIFSLHWIMNFQRHIYSRAPFKSDTIICLDIVKCFIKYQHDPLLVHQQQCMPALYDEI